jgi:hypothetical protein
MKTPAPETAAGRRKLAASGDALKDGTDPIPDVPYLKKAIRSIGRVDPSKRPAVKALIRKRATELGALNEPGVRGTWAFQGANSGEAVDLANGGRMPVIRGAADIQMGRTAPGVISVMHKSSGMKVGTITPKGAGWQATGADGTKAPASGSQQGALAGLIAWHNKMAAARNAKARDAAAAPASGIASVQGYAGEQAALEFAGSVPANSASDGPRVATMSGSGSASPAASAAGSKLGLTPEGAVVYAKLIRKGLKPNVALAFAKRAAAMHAKSATAKAAA